MIIGSVKENKEIEKRIAISPEIVKYSSLGFKIYLSENYGTHIGISDKQYLDFGVEILKDDKQILENSDLVLQLGLLSDEHCSYIKENQILIGALNPYNNKEKLAFSKETN